MTIKFASLGSVSTGTLKSSDLVEAFWNELEWQLGRQVRHPGTDECAELDKMREHVLGKIQDDAWTDDGSMIDDDEQLSYMVDELQDALGTFAGPYQYFGSHCGDGADFGYWPSMDEIEELPSYEDTNAAKDAGETGDFKVISDHGNVEIYSASGESILGIV